jgi:hypothetical protein
MAHYYRSFTACIVSTAVICVVAAGTAIFDTIAFGWQTCTSWVTDMVVKAAAKLPAARHWADPFQVEVMLVRARAFVARILHRDVPRLTPGWRLCPSI